MTRRTSKRRSSSRLRTNAEPRFRRMSSTRHSERKARRNQLEETRSKSVLPAGIIYHEKLRSNTRDFFVDSSGIAASLDKAARDWANHQKNVDRALAALPDGYTIKAGKKTWTKLTIAGDVFWTDGGRKFLPGGTLMVEIGSNRLVPHIGAEVLGF